MPHYSIAPWTRTLNRLDGIHSTHLRRCRHTIAPVIKRTDSTALSPHPTPTSHHSARPPAIPARDPFSQLPLTLITNIIQHLEPHDIVRLQRVSRGWKSILASEYIYTLALEMHFSGEDEAKAVRGIHEGGERFPECAVGVYLALAKRGG